MACDESYSFSPPPESLHVPYEPEFVDPEIDSFDDPTFNQVSDRMDRAILQSTIKSLLTDRQKEILSAISGLDGSCPLTVNDAAQEFGVNPNQIREHEIQSLKRLATSRKLLEVLRSYSKDFKVESTNAQAEHLTRNEAQALKLHWRRQGTYVPFFEHQPTRAN